MSKSSVYGTETEADTRAERIDPALHAAGWGAIDKSAAVSYTHLTLPTKA